jgi:aspartate kinase
MTVVVQKFGGSSLADLERLGEVAELVAHARKPGQGLVVVVSAMGKTTEQLLDLARRAASLAEPAAGFEAPRRELDLLVSSGERVSMALLAIALAARGVEAVSLTGSQAGVITSERHFDADVLEIRPARIVEALERGRVVIVAGYQGVSQTREVTTLGRGGSDTTAVALAAALNAVRCEIYSDVDGVYTADPHRIPGARHLASVDYDTVRAMAEAGARVLCARALEWGARHGVAIHARATRDFARAGRGRETRVVSDPNAEPARAVVVNREFALVSVPIEALEHARAGLEQARIRVRDRELRGDRAYLTLPLNGVPDYPSARRRLEQERVPGLVLEDDCAELSIVGPGVESDERAAPNFALGGAHISLRRQSRRSVVLSRNAVGEAERAWHDRIIAVA